MKQETRAFIAIELPQRIQIQIENIQKQLKLKLTSKVFRWVQSTNIHLTLKFLGNVSATNLDEIKKILVAEASRIEAFEISIRDLGTFPNIYRPRVIWMGINAPQELYDLQKNIEKQLVQLGIPQEERPFSPHLTLTRLDNNLSDTEISLVRALLKTKELGFSNSLIVESIQLFKSDLKPSGAVYTCLFRADLSKTATKI